MHEYGGGGSASAVEEKANGVDLVAGADMQIQCAGFGQGADHRSVGVEKVCARVHRCTSVHIGACTCVYVCERGGEEVSPT